MELLLGGIFNRFFTKQSNFMIYWPFRWVCRCSFDFFHPFNNSAESEIDSRNHMWNEPEKRSIFIDGWQSAAPHYLLVCDPLNWNWFQLDFLLYSLKKSEASFENVILRNLIKFLFSNSSPEGVGRSAIKKK